MRDTDRRPEHAVNGTVTEYVTVLLDGQLFGIPVKMVHDVFMPTRITRVPLAPPEIRGILNLRGRIVTAVDMRERLGLPKREDDTVMAIGVELGGESYGLIVDSVGEVLSLGDADIEANPANLDPRWRAVSTGVHRLENELLVVLDAVNALDFARRLDAA